MSLTTSLPPLFFDHIHKTAGTSIQALLTEIYGPENIARTDSQTETALREFEGFRAIVGHMTHSAGCWPFLQRYTLTLLRNPVARTLSYYHFCRQVGTFGTPRTKGKELLPSATSLEEFVASDTEAADLVTNFQTRHFASMAVGATSDLLKSAKAALERYHLVGAQEYLEETVRMLLADLQLPVRTELPTENVTSRYQGPEQLPISIRQAIEQRNQLDLELWTWARDRLRARRDQPPARIIVLSSPTRAAEAPRHETKDDGSVILVGAALRAADGRESQFATGEHITLTVELWSGRDLTDVTVGFSISSGSRQNLYGTNTYHLNRSVDLRAGVACQIRFAFPLNLAPGHYFAGLSCHAGRDTSHGYFLWRDAEVPLFVTNPWLPEFTGSTYLSTTVAVESPAPSTPMRWMAPLPPDQVRVRIELPPSLSTDRFHGHPKELIEIPVQITNLSPHTLASLSPFPVVISYHVRTVDGSLSLFDGRRTRLPAPLLPTSHADVITFIECPQLAGVYNVEISMVQEGRFWFDGSPESPSKVIELVVTDEKLPSAD